jgi:hypothetical protein
MLFEGVNIFGIHIQYWMPLAAVIATIAIAHSVRCFKLGHTAPPN